MNLYEGIKNNLKETSNDSLNIIKNKIDELISEGKIVKEDDSYVYIGLPEYFKDCSRDDDVIIKLHRHFSTDFLKQLKNSGIDATMSIDRSGPIDEAYYYVDAPIEITDNLAFSAEDLFNEKTGLNYVENFPTIKFGNDSMRNSDEKEEDKNETSSKSVGNVKCKVTFECSHCGNRFSDVFTFETKKIAEEVFESGADVNCPKCDSRSYPEEMEYIN